MEMKMGKAIILSKLVGATRDLYILFRKVISRSGYNNFNKNKTTKKGKMTFPSSYNCIKLEFLKHLFNNYNKKVFLQFPFKSMRKSGEFVYMMILEKIALNYFHIILLENCQFSNFILKNRIPETKLNWKYKLCFENTKGKLFLEKNHQKLPQVAPKYPSLLKKEHLYRNSKIIKTSVFHDKLDKAKKENGYKSPRRSVDRLHERLLEYFPKKNNFFSFNSNIRLTE